MSVYRYRLLRYAPTMSGEFYNVGLALYDAEDRLVDVRFTPDFERMRCNPAVDLGVLERLREEFEERRLLGEGFAEYFETLSRNLSDSLMITDGKPFEGHDVTAELDRLTQTYLVSPPKLEDGRETRASSGRLWVRGLLGNALEREGILGPGLVSEGIELAYAGPRLVFRFDYGYSVRGGEKLLHAVGSRGAVTEATRLAFVMDRLRGAGGSAPALTVVCEDGVGNDALELMEVSSIKRRSVDGIDRLAAEIRDELKR